MKERKLKVHTEYREEGVRNHHYTGYRTIPKIVLHGDWLRKVGFDIGDRIVVNCVDNILIISRERKNT